MTHSHTYKQCYELLNVDEQITSDELKKSYKKLIQKWHPDRYETDNEKEIATNKITSITTAYKQLTDYYRKNGCFPNVKPIPPVVPAKKHPPRTETPQVKPESPYDKNPVRSSSKAINQKYTPASTFFKVAGIIIIFILVYPYINDETADIKPSKSNKADRKEAQIATDKKKKSNKKRDIKKQTFTYGSSLGEVILVQGPPDRMEGNIWFYGKSEIHFKDGLVVYWLRDNKTPLNAEIKMRKHNP